MSPPPDDEVSSIYNISTRTNNNYQSNIPWTVSLSLNIPNMPEKELNEVMDQITY